jgi:hypothetical protein
MFSIEVRSMTENACLGGLDLIFRKTFDVWTKKVHQGSLIFESYKSWSSIVHSYGQVKSS